jgi:hypothetical protein
MCRIFGARKSDAPAIWRDAAQGRDAAVAGGIRRAPADIGCGDDAEAEGKGSAELLGKGHLRVSRGRETPTRPVTAEMKRAVDQNRSKTLQREAVRSIRGAGIGESKRKSWITGSRRRAKSLEFFRQNRAMINLTHMIV